MAHAVVAVDHRHRGTLLHDPDVRRHVDAAGTNPLDVLRQPDDAMAVGPLQVCLRHQAGNLVGIGGRQANPLQRAGDEGAQVLETGEVGTACLHGVRQSTMAWATRPLINRR
jgi:hypothetical protein